MTPSERPDLPDLSPGWSGDLRIGPGHILREVQEAYQPSVVVDRVTLEPLEYAAVWKAAQRVTGKPIKFGIISAQCLICTLWNQCYPSDTGIILDLCDVMSQERRDLAAAGARLRPPEPADHPGNRSLRIAIDTIIPSR